jgi:hypothetical protein
LSKNAYRSATGARDRVAPDPGLVVVVLPEQERRVHDVELERLVQRPHVLGERRARLVRGGRHQRLHAGPLPQRLDLHPPQVGPAPRGADPAFDEVGVRAAVVGDVVRRAVGERAGVVAGVEAVVVDRRHAALADPGREPPGRIERSEGGDDRVLVGGLLPDVETVPGGGSRLGAAEVPVLDVDLVGAGQPGRLGDVLEVHQVVVEVAGGEGDHRRAGVAVQEREPLLETAASGVAVVDGLAVLQEELAVSGGRMGRLGEVGDVRQVLEPRDDVVGGRRGRGRRRGAEQGGQDQGDGD